MPNMYELFKMFVASKPEDEKYASMDTKRCAMAQFGKHMYPDTFDCAGFSHFLINEGKEQLTSVKVAPLLHTEFTNALFFSRTFGELSEALEAIKL